MGCLTFFPLAGLLLAGTAVMGTLTMAMGVVISMVTIVTGTLVADLVGISVGFMAFWMFILS
jgi:hypothetical protein